MFWLYQSIKINMTNVALVVNSLIMFSQYKSDNFLLPFALDHKQHMSLILFILSLFQTDLQLLTLQNMSLGAKTLTLTIIYPRNLHLHNDLYLVINIHQDVH